MAGSGSAWQQQSSNSCWRRPRSPNARPRDLPGILTSGGLGATTVAATMFVAARIGIRIMATGGIGGVHQGGERTLDLSADLGCHR
jgi:pseudouridine-5'-phosphate glycosidase